VRVRVVPDQVPGH